MDPALRGYSVSEAPLVNVVKEEDERRMWDNITVTRK